MGVSATLLARLKATDTGSNALGTQSFSPDVKKQIDLTDGTAAGNADLFYADERTVADGANDDIDLYGGLTDAFGNTINMAEMVGILIINEQKDGTANTTDLTIGAATAPFTGFLGGTTPTIGPIKPGGFVMIGAGDAAGIGAIVDASSDTLRVANSAGAANIYQIAIVGRSA